MPLHVPSIKLRFCAALLAIPAMLIPSLAAAQSRESLDDAWWTGPIMAPSAGALPRGHFLFEPYVFDVIKPHSHYYGSLTYINAGLGDGITVGLIPTFGYSRAGYGGNSTRVGLGDWSVLGQYLLTQFHTGSRIPTTSVAIQQTFPTGKYDDLGSRPGDGLGAGAYTTQVSLYSQTYFWMPNGRILRTRLDLSESFSSRPRVNGVSVYGTPDSFHGSARPGNAFFGDLANEYSLTQRWVLALDLVYLAAGNTHVEGNVNAPVTMKGFVLNSGSSNAFAAAPALEYNFSSNVGVIGGVRVIKENRTTTGSITPVVAVNIVY